MINEISVNRAEKEGHELEMLDLDDWSGNKGHKEPLYDFLDDFKENGDEFSEYEGRVSEEEAEKGELSEKTRVTSVYGKSTETNSTNESQKKSGVTKPIHKTKYHNLFDEGKEYVYEEHPKKYMQIRKYQDSKAGKSRTGRARDACE
jgi:hypothetical protein